jgi:hypothetical protein
MSRGLKKVGFELKPSYAENFSDFCKAVSGDGDAAVDRWIQTKVVAAGFAWGDGADAV